MFPNIDHQHTSKEGLQHPHIQLVVQDDVLPPEEEHRLALQAEYADVEAPLYWYVDGRYWGTSTSQETLWWSLEEGAHRISVEDGQGHLAEAVIKIKEL